MCKPDPSLPVQGRLRLVSALLHFRRQCVLVWLLEVLHMPLSREPQAQRCGFDCAVTVCWFLFFLSAVSFFFPSLSLLSFFLLSFPLPFSPFFLFFLSFLLSFFLFSLIHLSFLHFLFSFLLSSSFLSLLLFSIVLLLSFFFSLFLLSFLLLSFLLSPFFHLFSFFLFLSPLPLPSFFSSLPPPFLPVFLPCFLIILILETVSSTSSNLDPRKKNTLSQRPPGKAAPVPSAVLKIEKKAESSLTCSGNLYCFGRAASESAQAAGPRPSSGATACENRLHRVKWPSGTHRDLAPHLGQICG